MYEVITAADREVLRETYRNASRAVESIYSMISRIEDEDLALDLNRQVCRYNAISDQAEEALLHAGLCPADGEMRNFFHRMRMYGRSMRDRSASHIASMVIEENMRGIAQTRQVMQENTGAKQVYCEMADELVAFEEKNIRQLQDYLENE